MSYWYRKCTVKVDQLDTITFRFQDATIVRAILFVRLTDQRRNIQGNGINDSTSNKGQNNKEPTVRHHHVSQQKFNYKVITKFLWLPDFDFNFSIVRS